MPRRKKPTKNAQPPPPPPPPPAPVVLSAFECLPDPTHVLVAAMVDSYKHESLLRLSGLSRTLLGIYGSMLKDLNVRGTPPNSNVDTLAALVERQHALEGVYSWGPGAIPAITHVLAQGGFRHLRKLIVQFDEPMALAHVESMAAALQVPGALQALEELSFCPDQAWVPGRLGLLVAPLASDAVAPSLRNLGVGGWGYEEEDLEALTATLEARARRTHPLVSEGVDMGDCSEAVRCRLLRATLPTTTFLYTELWWDPAYEAVLWPFNPLS